MTVIVVTGTSTDVGKTVVTAALAVGLDRAGARVAVCKPVQTGVAGDEDGDLAAVARLSDPLRRREYRECARYPDPLAPSVAARRCGRAPVTVSEIVDAVDDLRSRNDVVLLEGAGGVAVPFDDAGTTLLDVVAALTASVVVVTPPGLGALNHAALTVRALRHQDSRNSQVPRPLGLVLGSWPDTPDLAAVTNRTELPTVTGVPIIGAVPCGAGALDAEVFVGRAPAWIECSSLPIDPTPDFRRAS